MSYGLEAADSACSLLRILRNCWLIAWLGLGLTWMAGCGSSEKPADDAPSGSGEPLLAGPQQTPLVEKGPVTAEGLLKSMGTAYKKAPSYADRGIVRLVAQRDEGPIDETLQFSVALQRPNKLRMEVYQARVVCDGKRLNAAILDLSNQVLQKEAPAELTMPSIYRDRVLASALITGGYAGPSPQLNLLIGPAPIEELLEGVKETGLEEPESIQGRDCYRVRIERPDGTYVLWIDQQTLVLRRIVYPTGELQKMLSRGGTVGSVSLVADFRDAQLGGEIGPAAFQFETPAGTKLVKYFLPPHPAHLLNNKVPEYKFFDLDGKPVTPDSQAGKVVVLNFWAVGWKPSADHLPRFGQVCKQYQGNDKIAWLAVNVNDPNMDAKTLQEALATSGVPLPVLRDLEGNQGRVFHTVAVPATFIIDGRGALQDYEFGDNEKLLTALPAKLKKVLAGEAIYQQPLEAYQKELAEYEKILDAPDVPELPEGAAGEEQKIPIPQTELAPRSSPKVFQLTPLWTCTELKAPSNILVVPSADGPPRILVVDAWKSVAEVGADGKVIASHALKIAETEFINVLSTATTPEGKRFFLALALFTGQQRCHLLDENLDLRLSYPQDALENPHSGIADAHLADLDGDGKLELCVGYWGVVGVKTASLDGKPIGANRTSVVNVQRIALSGPDAQGRRRLLCANTSDALAVLDAQCRPQGTVVIPGRFLRNIVAADLDADGTPEWCGLAGVKVGDNLAVGLDLSGKELWTYTLPEGVHQLPVERIIPARLTADGPGQWLLPGPDGSIHVLAADGKPLDRFNYGAALAGLATAVIDGQPALIVSSPNGMEALTVQ